MKKMQVLIIGGGAAGMMAACGAAEAGHQVTLLEKNGRLGRKLALTGNGRCNVTNASDPETLLDHIVSNRNFLYSAFYGFSNEDMIRFLHEEGLETKVEEENRVFPATNRAADVIRVLENRMKRDGVRILLNKKVTGLLLDLPDGPESPSEPVCSGVKLSDGTRMNADVTILASGGLSYPVTGSDGEGLKMAEACGHTVRTPKPALTPFVIRETYGKQLQGRVFQDIRMTVTDPEGNRLFEDKGDVLFTHFGISGPMVLTASSYCTGFFKRTESDAPAESGTDSKTHFQTERREKNQKETQKISDPAGKKAPTLLKQGNTGKKAAASSVRPELTVKLDFFPEKNADQLERQLLDTLHSNGKKQLHTILETMMSKALVPVLLEQSGVEIHMKAGELPKPERLKLIRCMKGLTLHAAGLKGFREAMITQGGIRVSQVDPSTMASMNVTGLRFAGEILDLDALTGGYNLQIAWSTGWAAGSTIGAEY